VGAAALAACSDSGGPGGGISIDDLVGAWKATTVTYTSQADAGERIDRIAGGGFATATVGDEGAYAFVLVPADGEPEVGSGFMIVESGFLLVQNITEPGLTIAFAVTLGNGTLGLVSDEPTYDFDGDGETEPAILQIRLGRISGASIADLEGEWTATEYRLISQPAEADTFDIIAENGGLAMAIDAVGRYSAEIAEPGEPPIVEAGLATVDGDELILVPMGQVVPTEFTFQLSSDTLLLEGEAQYDFGGGGTVMDARVEIMLVRS
jgi:hypothetical protein